MRRLLVVLSLVLMLSLSCDDPNVPRLNPETISLPVGSAGGQAVSKDGQVSIAIPPGALNSGRTITIEPVEPARLGAEFRDLTVTKAFELGPDGTVFTSPATITVKSDQIPVRDGLTLTALAEQLYTSENGRAVPLTNTAVTINENDVIVTGELSHFSPAVLVTDKQPTKIAISGVPDAAYVGEVVEVNMAGSSPGLDVDRVGIQDISSRFTLDEQTHFVNPPQYTGNYLYSCKSSGPAGFRVFIHVLAPNGSSRAYWLEKNLVCKGDRHNMTIIKKGDGNGTVVVTFSRPGGNDEITCGPESARCEGPFASGEGGMSYRVFADADSYVVGSEGDCLFDLTPKRDLECVFEFAKKKPSHTVRVETAGKGVGDVVDDKGEINCSSRTDGPKDCEGQYPEGTAAVLFATPGPNARFFNWTGCGESTDPEHRVVVGTTDVTCKVLFPLDQVDIGVTPAALNMTTGQTFAGFEAVVSDETGIRGNVEIVYSSSDETVLTVTREGQVTALKEGKASVIATAVGVSEGKVEIPVDVRTPTYNVLVTIIGDGAVFGSSAEDPTGNVWCSIEASPCSLTSFAGDSWVSFEPLPGSGWKFSEFQGDCAPDGGFDIQNANRVCTVVFVPDLVMVRLDLSVIGDGDGTITGPGVDCGSQCFTLLPQGSQITLVFAGNSDSFFGHWTGACAPAGINEVAEIVASSDLECGAVAHLSPLRIEVTPSSLQLNADELQQLQFALSDLRGTPVAGRTLTFESLDQDIVTVTEDGLVAAMAPGNTAIRVTANGDGGVSVDVPVAVEPPGTFTLKITQTGDGEGTILWQLAGNNIANPCGASCSIDLLIGQVFTVSAFPAPSSVLHSVTGYCSNMNPASTASGVQECIVRFDRPSAPTHPVSVAIEAGADVRVTSNPEGIDCSGLADGPQVCSAEFAEGTPVVLTAVPGPLADWEGFTCNGQDENSLEHTVVADGAVDCTTRSTGLRYIDLDITGEGKILQSPDGEVACDAGDCWDALLAHEQDAIGLTAVPDPGWSFVTWLGACEPQGTPATTVPPSSEKQLCTAVFEPTPVRYIDLRIEGEGTIVMMPDGALVCDQAECRQAVLAQITDAIDLGAVPDPGWRFVEWLGACQPQNTPATTAPPDADTQSCTAVFETVPAQYAVSVLTTGAGTGLVVSDIAGIDCGAVCTALFEEGQTVTLTSSADANSLRGAWGGTACEHAGSAASVTIVVDGPVECSAHFYDLPVSIDLETPAGPLMVGNTLQLNPVLTDGAGEPVTGLTVIYQSLTPDVASVSATGEVTAEAAGDAAIEVSVDGFEEATVTVEFRIDEPMRVVLFDIYGSGRIEFLRGAGTVTCSPAATENCQQEFFVSETINLTAIPDAGHRFVEWDSDCEPGGVLPASTESQFCVAVFEEIPPPQMFDLTLIPRGQGTAEYVVTPESLNCDFFNNLVCSIPEGQQVTITSVPEPGAFHGNWLGAGCIHGGINPTVVVTMDAAKTCNPLIQLLPVSITANNGIVELGKNSLVFFLVRDLAGEFVASRPMTFTSSNPAVATVSSMGFVNGVSLGTTEITITLDQGPLQATSTITYEVIPVQPQCPTSASLTMDVTVLSDPNNNAAAINMPNPINLSLSRSSSSVFANGPAPIGSMSGSISSATANPACTFNMHGFRTINGVPNVPVNLQGQFLDAPFDLTFTVNGTVFGLVSRP